MGFVKLVDKSGSSELVVFPSIWQKTAGFWEPDKILLIAGKVSRRDGDPKIIADSAEELAAGAEAEIIRRWSRLRFQRRESVAADLNADVNAAIDSDRAG